MTRPSLPEGLRFLAPEEAAERAAAIDALRALYRSWGYARVEVPALERLEPDHPRASKAFKLVDVGGGVLALRSDFTPALARLVRAAYPAVAAGAERPLRLSYDGLVWHAIDPELARGREFTQVGIELVGVSSARADAELIHLARESVRALGLTPRVEVGNPAYVTALFDAAGVADGARASLADAIDRKDQSAVAALVAGHRLRGAAADAILAVPDLYGGPEVLDEALARAPTAAAGQALERLAGVLDEFEDMGDLMLDLGMARRLSYYTGVTFRAYTFDFGQPLLGGGRYDGSLLPRAAGFALGLGRVLAAVASAREQEGPAEGRGGHGTGGARRAGDDPLVASLDDPGARVLRAAGVRVVRAIAADPDAARAEAVTLGADFMLAPPGAGGSPAERLVALRDDVDPAAGERLRQVLAGARA
ncbi:MAG TPA: ATP phosphoribosyltransferase regulatory subunit [Trueperaceae bacterium]|nr:ATP phosphoribosyltransferase regulatory subunit [Trueperaceae bacterium]